MSIPECVPSLKEISLGFRKSRGLRKENNILNLICKQGRIQPFLFMAVALESLELFFFNW